MTKEKANRGRGEVFIDFQFKHCVKIFFRNILKITPLQPSGERKTLKFIASEFKMLRASEGYIHTDILFIMCSPN